MRALLRYQFAVLFRSHRWVFPLVTFVLLISVGGVGQTQPRRAFVQRLARQRGAERQRGCRPVGGLAGRSAVPGRREPGSAGLGPVRVAGGPALWLAASAESSWSWSAPAADRA